MPHLKNKRILFCGLNIDYLLVDLTYCKFGSDFSEKLVKFLLETLRLNDNHLYGTPVNCKVAICRYSELLTGVSFVKAI